MLPYLKRLHSKGHLDLATEIVKGFSPDVFNSLYVNHSKSSNSGSLEPNSDLIIPFFYKLALKATVVNSDSWYEA